MGSNFPHPQNKWGWLLLSFSCFPIQIHSCAVLLADAEPVTEERPRVPQGTSNLIVLSVNNTSKGAPERHGRNFMT